MPGQGPLTTVESASRYGKSFAGGLHPYLRGQFLGLHQEFVPSSRPNPSSPATLPWTSMIRCAFLSSFSRLTFSRSSLRTFSSSGFRSLGSRPCFSDRPFRDPMRAALRHAVRCDGYRQALAPQEVADLPWFPTPVPFFDDPYLVRRRGLPPERPIHGFRVWWGCWASLALLVWRGCLLLFHSLSQFQHPRVLRLALL